MKNGQAPGLETPSQSLDGDCSGCVFYPPNLPESAYPAADYAMLQQKHCSFDFSPNDPDCLQTRKTSCSLLDLGKTL